MRLPSRRSGVPAVMLRPSKRSSAEAAVLFSLIDYHVCTLKPVFWDQDSLGLFALGCSGV